MRWLALLALSCGSLPGVETLAPVGAAGAEVAGASAGTDALAGGAGVSGAPAAGSAGVEFVPAGGNSGGNSVPPCPSCAGTAGVSGDGGVGAGGAAPEAGRPTGGAGVGGSSGAVAAGAGGSGACPSGHQVVSFPDCQAMTSSSTRGWYADAGCGQELLWTTRSVQPGYTICQQDRGVLEQAWKAGSLFTFDPTKTPAAWRLVDGLCSPSEDIPTGYAGPYFGTERSMEGLRAETCR